ncbi:MAG TPA: GNAT family N-acetyltransferase, partial [Afipia sp.]
MNQGPVMTMTAALQNGSAHPAAQANAERVVRIDVVRGMREAEAVWRAFESGDCLSTPYQRFDLLNAWQTNVGADEGAKPFIVIAYDDSDRPLLLLPLVTIREN